MNSTAKKAVLIGCALPVVLFFGLAFVVALYQVVTGTVPPDSTYTVAEQTQPDVPYRAVEQQPVPGLKYSIDFHFDAPKGTLPTREQMIRMSDDVEGNNPGYQRYFVGFFLPGMEENAGYFATAHRPNVKLEISPFVAPEDRHEEIQAFYGIDVLGKPIAAD
jgi:hypothetical protein